MSAAGVVASIHPGAAWIERSYVNGGYPVWQHIARAIAAPFPFSLGDLVAIALLAFFVLSLRRGLRGLFDAMLVLLVAYAWFEIAWGWNYARAPIEARIGTFDAAAVNTRAVAALRAKAIAELNALAPSAHARERVGYDRAELRAAWLPVVHALGDRWNPHVGAPKWTIVGPFMALNGTEGFINPLTLESQLAPDLLWFEVPFDLAHEWSHVAGFAREDEANYIGALACLRDPDPIARYSGWMSVLFALPPLPHYAKNTFTPLVWSDFAAIRARNARNLNVAFARFSWGTYNHYLKSNHVASGIANYDEVTRLLLGIPRTRSGLPRVTLR